MKRSLSLSILAALATAAIAQEDPDRRKNATALFNDGLRAETQPPVNLQVALQKYAKAIALAEKEGNAVIGAAATAHAAMCNEKLDPENISEALSKWNDCANKFGGDPSYGERAKRKAAFKGVDLYLEKLHAQLDAWRVKPGRPTADLNQMKDATTEKIKAVAPEMDAIPGLVSGLGHPDELIRDYAGGYLAEVIDEAGITTVIEKLNDPKETLRAGASNAFQKIFKKYNEAVALITRANNIDRDMNVNILTWDRQKSPDPKGTVDKLKAEGQKFRDTAKKILNHIPETIGTPKIQEGLAAIIGDENAFAQSRREAALALKWIGLVSGNLADALIKGMDSKDHSVREACCRAAGSVNTAISADKHKLADRLMKAATDEPAKTAASGSSEPDWVNDEAVRQAACESLEQIGLVKTLPSLIKALEDNDTRVRHAAHQALKEIIGKDLEYDKDDKGNPKTYEADKPLEERKKAKAKYDEWWEKTKGVVVLVERFWRFQSRSTEASAVKLFDKEAYLRELESKKWASSDYQADLVRATRIVDDFLRAKEVFTQDAQDLGPEAGPNLIVFIGGETDLEPQGNAATRYFVAEASARLGAVDLIREKLDKGDNAAKKAGAALALGFLPQDKVTDQDRELLATRGLGDADPMVKEAAAIALGKVGNDRNAAALTAAAIDGANPDVQLAALRALALIHPKNDAAVSALSELVGDEPPGGAASKKAKSQFAREYAVTALGAIGDSKAMEALLRACRDEMKNVREAARFAVQNVYKADANGAKTTCLATLKDEKKKTDDRSGSALALGYMGEPALGKELAQRLRDPNPPRFLKDQDPGVRMKVCEALGSMGANGKKKSICEALVAALGDDGETNDVRLSAYNALKAIFDINPEAEGASPDVKTLLFGFTKEISLPIRNEAGKKWTAYLSGQNLSD